MDEHASIFELCSLSSAHSHLVMCGLTLSIRFVADSQPAPDPIFDSLCSANSSRGPDSSSTYTHYISHAEGQIEIRLAASVLGLRGDGITAQPLVGQQGVLGWNGQVRSSSRFGLPD